jgi:putative transposase
MKLVRTIKIMLPNAVEALMPTVKAYTNAYNMVVKTGFDKKQYNGVKLHHLCYQDIREQFNLPSQLAISARMKATDSLKSIGAKRKKKQKISCPISKQQSIRYDARSYTLSLIDKTVSLLTLEGRKHFSFQLPKHFEQYLTWKTTSAELKIYGKQTFLCVAMQQEITDTPTNGRLIGIDRGIKNLATLSTNKFFSGGKIKQVSIRYRTLRSSLQAKGSRSAQRHLVLLRKKEHRFRTDINHTIAKQIVNSLQSGDTIVLEKLTGIRNNVKLRKKQRTELHSWNFFQLEQFLIYKAAAKGIQVVFVDARYTSQRCSVCGHIERANRKQQSQFQCKECGFRLHADLNAARNICNKYLDATSYPSKGTVNCPNGSNANVQVVRSKNKSATFVADY